MSMDYTIQMMKTTRVNSKIAIYVLCYLVFFEYISISIKEITGLEFIGAARDATLILMSFFGIYKHKKFSIQLYLLVLAVYCISLWNADVRPFANLVSAFIIGYTIRISSRPYRSVLIALIGICTLVILYQSVHISDFEQFWFYNYLNDKEGYLFLATQYAYFRDGVVRPTGIMVSPSVMGLALIALGYLYKTSVKPRSNPYLAYAIILISLYLIQTRALFIGYILYVFIEMNIARMSSKKIALLYFSAIVVVFFGIIYAGDDGAYVRALLLFSVFDYLSSGILFPYLQANQSIVVDSQLIGFFYLSGIAGILFLALLFKRAIKASSLSDNLISFNFISFCFFISVFQWSGDSFGFLTGFYALGQVFNNYRLFLRSASNLPDKLVARRIRIIEN